MSKAPYYSGKHNAPRHEITANAVSQLRARAAELGHAVPAHAQYGHAGNGNPLRHSAERQAIRARPASRVPSNPQTAVRTPTPIPMSLTGTTTQPQAAAISEFDLDAIRPGYWWRSLRHRVGSLFK